MTNEDEIRFVEVLIRIGLGQTLCRCMGKDDLPRCTAMRGEKNKHTRCSREVGHEGAHVGFVDDEHVEAFVWL